MKHRIFTSSVVQAALVIACTALLTLTVLSAMNRYDNKYITKAALTQDQFCIIPENGYCALVDGWELYSDVLLSPDDFRTETPSPSSHGQGNIPTSPCFTRTKILTEPQHGGCIYRAMAMYRSTSKSRSAPRASL